MPPDIRFEALRRTDAEIMDAFRAFSTELSLPAETLRVHLMVVDDQPAVEFTLNDADQQPVVTLANERRTALWWQTRLQFVSNGHGNVYVRRQENGRDGIQVSFPVQKAPEQALRLVAATQAAFGPPAQSVAVEKVLGPEIADFYQRREYDLKRLEDLAQRITEETDAHRRRLEEATDKLRTSLHEQAAKTEEELRRTYQSKVDHVETRAQALAAREKELDDRSSRHARRDSVKGLKQIITSREASFQLTKDTQRKRWPIHLIFIALIAASATVLGVGLFRPPDAAEQGPLLWIHVARIPAGILGFAFAAIYYIRWNDQWFRQHADEEFKMRQLELDVDRASWVTELALELRDEKGELPAALIDRLSTGLFVARNSEGVKHPTQDILSTIIGASTRLRLSLPGGIEADVNRSGVKKIKDELGKD